jgi:hypothetical protein
MASAVPRVSPKVARRQTTRDRIARESRRADQTISELSSPHEEGHVTTSPLGAHVRRQFDAARRSRDSTGISERLLHCLRAYNGEYSPVQLTKIASFGGSDAFLRLTAVKCRTLVAMLSELYLGNDRPWELAPTPNPTLPDDIVAAVGTVALASDEPEQAHQQLTKEAKAIAKQKAVADAKSTSDTLDDALYEGDFYEAFKEFLTHFAQYPFGVLKGPFYRHTRKIRYVNKRPKVVVEPQQFWSSPNPFDVWLSPGVARAGDGDVFERVRYSRADLEALIDLPFYDGVALQALLARHPDGYDEPLLSSVEEARKQEEARDDMFASQSNLYDVIEFHGFVRGDMLILEPLLSGQLPPEPNPTPVDKPLLSRHVSIRMLAGVIISVNYNPDPLERPIYHISSFEMVPGSAYGRGLPEVLVDAQGLANAALRALINNIGMSSGPMIGLNTTALTDTENTDEIFPWKMFRFAPDPAAPTATPMVFFQPQDNSAGLLATLENAMRLADEVSAIPRYASGSERAGGAARTASGLAQLQGNVARLVKHIAGNVDVHILAPVLKLLYDMRMLDPADTMFEGDETIRPLGVQAAQKAETERMRALEFLGVTNNPVDAQLMGPEGRIHLLKEVATNLGFDHSALEIMFDKRLADLKKQGTDPTANPTANGDTSQAPKPADGPPGVAQPIEGMATVRPPEQIANATMPG